MYEQKSAVCDNLWGVRFLKLLSRFLFSVWMNKAISLQQAQLNKQRFCPDFWGFNHNYSNVEDCSAPLHSPTIPNPTPAPLYLTIFKFDPSCRMETKFSCTEIASLSIVKWQLCHLCCKILGFQQCLNMKRVWNWSTKYPYWNITRCATFKYLTEFLHFFRSRKKLELSTILGNYQEMRFT